MHIIGVDTGGSYTRIWNGIQPVRKMVTPHHYPQYLQMLSTALKEYEPIQTLVIALPAVIAHHCVVKAPNLGDGWNNQNIEADIRKLLMVKGHVHICQDTEAAGYAVQMQELDLDPTMIVTLSTGVGGALVNKRQVLPFCVAVVSQAV
ncbi:MAG: ROK family protein [Chloroflexi bacterium]|nr:MAG: ROK family protein [Chloroflexota bacterium]